MPTEWRNKRGKSMWQPTLASGDRLWSVYLWGEADGKRWMHLDADARKDAALYSRRTAERIERRKQARLDRQMYDETFEEVRRES
jgi:hypothetical protein